MTDLVMAREKTAVEPLANKAAIRDKKASFHSATTRLSGNRGRSDRLLAPF